MGTDKEMAADGKPKFSGDDARLLCFVGFAIAEALQKAANEYPRFELRKAYSWYRETMDSFTKLYREISEEADKRPVPEGDTLGRKD